LKHDRDVTLLTAPVLLISTDLRRAGTTPLLTGLNAVWEMPSHNEVDCVVVWVESRLAPDVRLSTRTTTSWFPTIYRIAPPSRPFEKMEFTLSLTPGSNYWTVDFASSGHRETRKYSPEFAAMQMIAAARGTEVKNEHGRLVLAHDHQQPSVIELCAATSDDQDFLRKLYYTTRTDEVSAFGWNESEQDSFLNMQFEMQQRAYAMQFPAAECSIILFDGVPVGRLIVDRSGDAVSLTDITVAPEFRGRGIGSRLIGRLQGEGKAIVLNVDKQNADARRLYQRLGFTETGETELAYSMRWDGRNK
jgi:ribosomal protein S18 acetylase RimI-like enzyme